MSYFSLLALFPMLLALLALSNRIAAGSQFFRRIVAGYPGSAEFLQTTTRELSHVGAGVVITCVFVMLWAGSWVFSVTERAVNRVWSSRPRRFLHGRALTLVMFATIGVALALSVFTTSLLVTVRELAARTPLRVLQRVPALAFIGDAFWQIVFALVSSLVTIALFTLVYRFIPNTRVALHESIPSAIVAGLLWEAAKYIFAWSLQYFHYDEIYGSVGAVVAVLTWGYVSSLILLFGAQLSKSLKEELWKQSNRRRAAESAERNKK